MTDATEIAGAATSEDPAVGLAAVSSLRVLLETLEELQVESARAQGWSWERIARALGVSKQAVHQKYGRGRGLLRRRKA
jgi:DNA-directed RNA polymerase specialized sigma24 family protein